MRLVLLFVAIGLLGSLQAQTDISERFIKPLKIAPSVSGSFGELRSNHFHSGIDLTTNQKTGYRVYASDKGYVSRIKVSPYGYGKAIYIDHEGGYTTVYAHLERYADKIDSLVKAEQYKTQSFAVEFFPKENEIPIERGEVIAYSGNSGSSGGPHLHYEVRDKATQEPMDPMQFRNDIKDDVKPQIQGLKLYCLSDKANIQGRRHDKYIPVVYYDKAFHPKGTRSFTAYGKIGVGVQVLDYLSDSWRKCGISTIDLFVNDSLVYNFKIDRFSFAETRYLNSHIDYAEKLKSGKVIQKSFVEPNNQLSLYGVKNEYTLTINTGEEKLLKYVIVDYSGNKSELAFTLKGGNPLEIPVERNKNLIHVNYNKALNLDTLGLKLQIPSNTFYTDIDLLIHKDNKEGFIAPVYVIGNRNIPMHKSMSLSLTVPDSLLKYENKLVVAGVSSSGKTYSLGGSLTNKDIKTSTRGFGRFTLAIDTIQPKVLLHKAPQANNYASRKSIDVIISDNFSGIKKYSCWINDEWVLFEYDAKKNLLSGNFKDMPMVQKGQHQLRIVVEDNRGNVTEKKHTIKR